MTSLKSLNLAASGLLGPFPDELGNLTKLRNLAMESNEIQGMIPSTLNRMCSLQNIYLSQINIGGDIAHLMDRIPKCSLNSLQELFLDRTNITGTIIESVSNFTALSILDISYNHLSGCLPVEIGMLKNLTELIIPGNGFSGVISEEHFSGLTNLKYIDLTDTHLQVMVGSDWEPRSICTRHIYHPVIWVKSLIGFDGKKAFHTSAFQTQVSLVRSRIGFGLHFLMPHLWTSLTTKLLVSYLLIWSSCLQQRFFSSQII